MGKIVTPSDFELQPYFIPGAVSVNSGEGANLDLDKLIDELEVRFLEDALGKVQADEFYSALDDLGAADQKWQDLFNGKDEYGGIKRVFVPFLFTEWIRNNEIRLSNSGAHRPKVKGSWTADFNQHFVEAWSRFLSLYQNVSSDSWGRYFDLGADGYDPKTLKEFIEETDGIDDQFFRLYEQQNQLGF